MSMKRKLFLAIVGLLAALLAACSSGTEPAQVPSATAVSVSVAATSAPGAATSAPGAATAGKPEAGKASVVGRVLSKLTGAPIAGTSVRLAEVTRQGDEAIYVLDGANSPGAETGGDGSFVMENIVAREYVIVVGDPFANHEIIKDDATRARVWNAAADQVLDVGELRVDIGQ
jgi:hypothetical protein